MQHYFLEVQLISGALLYYMFEEGRRDESAIKEISRKERGFKERLLEIGGGSRGRQGRKRVLEEAVGRSQGEGGATGLEEPGVD